MPVKIHIYKRLSPLEAVHDDSHAVIGVILGHTVNFVRNFRCNNCAWVVFQYEGDILEILLDGAVPQHEPRADIKCGRCNYVYRLVLL